MDTWDLGLRMVQYIPEIGEKPNDFLVVETTGLRALEVKESCWVNILIQNQSHLYFCVSFLLPPPQEVFDYPLKRSCYLIPSLAISVPSRSSWDGSTKPIKYVLSLPCKPCHYHMGNNVMTFALTVASARKCLPQMTTWMPPHPTGFSRMPSLKQTWAHRMFMSGYFWTQQWKGGEGSYMDSASSTAPGGDSETEIAHQVILFGLLYPTLISH